MCVSEVGLSQQRMLYEARKMWWCCRILSVRGNGARGGEQNKKHFTEQIKVRDENDVQTRWRRRST